MSTIIEATAEHLKDLVPLFDAYRIFYRQASNLKAAHEYLQARIELKESIIFMAYDEEGIAMGFTQLFPLFSSVRMKSMWLLNDLYVDASHRGKGISKALIDRAKALAKATHASGISLETEKSNLIGGKLYPATGFELNESNDFYFWEA